MSVVKRCRFYGNHGQRQRYARVEGIEAELQPKGCLKPGCQHNERKESHHDRRYAGQQFNRRFYDLANSAWRKL